VISVQGNKEVWEAGVWQGTARDRDEETEGADDFGERLYIRGEEKLSLSLARNLLLISDGARWISDIAGADYLKATYQLNWCH